ncbi:hypothetical protein SDC9_108019 [bioreactor metagenome]|uniref:Uncharacterized protein n=1 Tax=bioreactor metagenome TaxID=1076179 RepID=A0A645BDA6_9ZZZZ
MHIAGGADVKAPGGVHSHQQVRIALQLAGQNDLLLVSAGEIAALLIHGLAADVVFLLHSQRIVMDGLFLQA